MTILQRDSGVWSCQIQMSISLGNILFVTAGLHLLTNILLTSENALFVSSPHTHHTLNLRRVEEDRTVCLLLPAGQEERCCEHHVFLVSWHHAAHHTSWCRWGPRTEEKLCAPILTLHAQLWNSSTDPNIRSKTNSGSTPRQLLHSWKATSLGSALTQCSLTSYLHAQNKFTNHCQTNAQQDFNRKGILHIRGYTVAESLLQQPKQIQESCFSASKLQIKHLFVPIKYRSRNPEDKSRYSMFLWIIFVQQLLFGTRCRQILIWREVDKDDLKLRALRVRRLSPASESVLWSVWIVGTKTENEGKRTENCGENWSEEYVCECVLQ